MRTTVCTVALLVGALSGAGAARGAQTATLQPTRDNTLFEDLTEPITELSSGAGEFLFFGRLGVNGNGALRRGLLKFDVAGTVPEGALIRSATLTVNVAQAIGGNRTAQLRRLLADWGEGSSDSGFGGEGAAADEGDATWSYAFYDTVSWTGGGAEGDYSSTISASTSIDDVGEYSWASTAQTVADVQLWLDQPETSFGWIVFGDEAEMFTAKKVYSRDTPEENVEPRLEITYLEPIFGDDFEAGDFDPGWSVGPPP